jgi:hypothetical protein
MPVPARMRASPCAPPFSGMIASTRIAVLFERSLFTVLLRFEELRKRATVPKTVVPTRP